MGMPMGKQASEASSLAHGGHRAFGRARGTEGIDLRPLHVIE
jgi:hypothetical protein